MANMDFSREFFNRMEELDRHRLKMLIAPAGYGKSAAVKLWYSLILKSVPVHVILDGEEEDDFWQSLCDGFDEFYPALSSVLRRMNFPENEAERESCTALMAEAFKEKGFPCCIIVENLHKAEDAKILSLFRHWLERLDESVGFLLVSEREPDLHWADKDILTAADFELPHRELLEDVKGKVWEPLDDRQKMFFAANSRVSSFTEEQALYIWNANDGEILFEELICRFPFVLGNRGRYRIHDLLRKYAEAHFSQISPMMQQRFTERLTQWQKEHPQEG